MMDIDDSVGDDSRVTLGESGPFEAHYTFAVYEAPTAKPFVFQYDQGRNHWESGVALASLSEMAGNPRFFDHLVKSNCAWAIPIFEAGFLSGDSAATVARLVSWSRELRDVQDEGSS